MTVSTVFAGVGNVLISDGSSSILIDGYFSRPSLGRLLLGRLRPDRRRIEQSLARLEIDGLKAVLVSHSHFDHALDSPVVAQMTGAELGGSPSTRMIARGYELGDVPFRELHDGEPFSVGAFTVTPVRALHSDGDRFPGDITEPLTLPASTTDFRTGGCFSFHVAHPDGTVFIHPTANFIPGALADYSADVVYLGAGTVGSKSQEWIRDYWGETVEQLSARVVRPIHWDAFWRPLTKPLRGMPRPLDRLAVTMQEFGRLAGPHVHVALPQLWQKELVTPRQ